MWGTTFIAATLTIALATIPSSPAKAASMPSVAALAQQCAPNVSPLTMASVVARESAARRLAINVNGNYRLPRQPTNKDEAAATVDWLEAHDFNFDVGIAQINSGNFSHLGVSARELLDPCTNLKAAAVVLSDCYARAIKAGGEGQKALLHALSCYNTGSQTRGFTNGYVSQVVAQARVLQIPALLSDSGSAASGTQPVASAAGGKSAGKEKLAGSVPASASSVNDAASESQGAFSHADPGAFGSETKPESP